MSDPREPRSLSPVRLFQSPATTATALHHHQFSSRWPSPEQQRGIAALSTLNDSEIFSNLTHLRSVTPNLTNQQLGALASLRSTPDVYIKTWLDCGRRFSGSTQSERSSLASNVSDSRFSTASWPTNNTSLSGPPSLSQTPFAIKGLGLNEAAQDSTVHHEVNVPPDLNKAQPPLPQGLLDSTVPTQETCSSKHGPRYERWCTTREHKTVFTSERGFAKHENEHDKCYVFLPQGPIETTPWGSQCALCETADPSKVHLQDHNILQYDGWLGKPITRSRKGNFEELLKKHKASDEKIKILLNKWRVVRDKKAYSCGFCISIFKKLSDRTSHIDREHYAKGKHIDEWEDTFVIKGLLLQREVKQECLKLFYPVDPTAVETRVSWPSSVVDKLQLRLELGEEAAEALAICVFREASTRGIFPSYRSNAASNLGPRSEITGRIQRSSSIPERTSFERGSATDHVQFLTQQSDSFEGLQAQHQTYSNELNSMAFSHMSVSSSSSNPQVLKTSPGFPIRSSSLAGSATGNTGFMNATCEDACEAAQIPFTCRVPRNVLPSHDPDQMGMDGSSSHDHPYSSGPMSESNSYQVPYFSASASEAASHAASRLDPFTDDASPISLEPSITLQAPKRKLSDKSAKAANLKAQTQAPAWTYNQQYSLPSS